ncbi:MAG TPA: ABC transporter ATP-binding protein [Candidatus Korarchaeota archaeon]|nr:ABC transporter ATP-binding protein [Candidatus Korarchaeota archaeon]
MLKIENVTFRYEGSSQPALSDVSLKVDEGEFLLVAGLSGSGKSTLLRLLNGLIPHFYKGEMKGRVLVDGVDTREASVAQLAKKVGLVFQNPDNQIVTLRVDREIAFGLENLGLPREEIIKRVNDVLRKLGIEHLRKRSTHELSGGEKQLVAIASVLAMEPSVIALDEPTSELDPFSSARIAKVLGNLNREGISVIVAEHRLDLFTPKASRMVVMSNGRIVKEGDPRELLYRGDISVYGVRPPSVVKLARRYGVQDRRPLMVGELVAAVRKGVGVDRG